jgi:predicted lipid-binding transport protein (Tim44 family)
MKLKTLMTAVLTLVVAGLFSMPEPAEAKRFGGGGNVGRQSSSMPRQADAPRATQAPNPAQGTAAAAGARAPQAGGASRWLGPLAGLAAGGLLASLFMGGGFEGFQIMDFLVIVALAVGGYLIYRKLRGGRAAPRPAAAGVFGGAAPAGAAPYQRQGPMDFGSSAAPGPQGIRSGGLGMPGMGANAPQPAGADQFPHWFDGPGFIGGAKTHFIRLQAAWDKADYRDIREYTTPQMFAEIQREREALGGPQSTEVVRVQAELVTIQRDRDLAVASIRFSGLIREDAQGVAEEFSEIWHIQHVWDTPEGDWLIAGIQQV